MHSCRLAPLLLAIAPLTSSLAADPPTLAAFLQERLFALSDTPRVIEVSDVATAFALDTASGTFSTEYDRLRWLNLHGGTATPLASLPVEIMRLPSGWIDVDIRFNPAETCVPHVELTKLFAAHKYRPQFNSYTITRDLSTASQFSGKRLHTWSMVLSADEHCLYGISLRTSQQRG